MTDDLGRKLENLAERLPEGRPDVATVVARGKRTRLVRYGGTTLGAIVVAAVSTFAAVNLEVKQPETGTPPAHHDGGAFVPAEPGEPTYVLTDFRIEYPWAKVDSMPGLRPGSDKRELYCSTPEREEECVSEGNAGFFYEWHWSTGRFPGVVACRVRLFAQDDRQVGEQDWELSGLESSSRRASDVLVHVTAKPTSAEASCEAGTLDSGPTHTFTFIRAESYNTNPRPKAQPAYRNRLYFEVKTLTEHSTGICRSTVIYESGKTISGTFTMTGAPRESELFEFGAPYREGDPVEDASIRCRLYKREAKG
jgi:hypothetical protein